MKKIIIGALFTVVGACANAQLTGNLYLVQADDLMAGVANQEFSDFPTFSIAAGNVVTFGTAVNLSDVQIRYSTSSSTFNPTQARLTISTFVAAPSNDHAPGGVSAGSSIVFDGLRSFTKTNISGGLFNGVTDATGITLAAGTYLFTAASLTTFGVDGQAFATLSSSPVADSWVRNTGGGFGLSNGTNWSTLSTSGITTEQQIGMGINGTNAVPEPATMMVLGLGAAAMLRRRRK